ncbi:hypothetical protein V2J09_002412 [Rumex salicifolius]
MHLMSTPSLLCNNSSPPILFGLRCPCGTSNRSTREGNWFPVKISSRRFRRRQLRIPKANVNGDDYSDRRKKKKSWWKNFFFVDDGNWLGLKDEDMVESEEEVRDFGKRNEREEGELSEKEKFEEWKKRAEAIVELREAQEGLTNQESRNWEDWVVGDDNWDAGGGGGGDGVGDRSYSGEIVLPERGLVEKASNYFFQTEDDDDLLYEDRVFRYASINSAKFLAVLIIVPWALDFLVHDYALMPFLDRYVKTVPLAAELLDVRRSQKLEMVKELKSEGARLRFEAEIGKAPTLNEEETWDELRLKALELRDERRLDNRSAFANIWSDMVFGISLFILLYFNQTKVALLKFTGYKILNNVSDTGKAFLIILITDIFLGYHSESGWETLCEVIVEHYGIEVDQATITIFICLVPVILDACVKLWLFKFLPRLSPKVSNIFNEMKRH